MVPALFCNFYLVINDNIANDTTSTEVGEISTDLESVDI